MLQNKQAQTLHTNMSTWDIKPEGEQQLTLIRDQLMDFIEERWGSGGEPRREKTEEGLYLADNIAAAAAVFMRGGLRLGFLEPGSHMARNAQTLNLLPLIEFHHAGNIGLLVSKPQVFCDWLEEEDTVILDLITE